VRFGAAGDGCLRCGGTRCAKQYTLSGRWRTPEQVYAWRLVLYRDARAGWLADLLGAEVRDKSTRRVLARPLGGPAGGPQDAQHGTRDSHGSYPCLTDTLGSSQVRRSVYGYPDGSFDGHAVIRPRRLRLEESIEFHRGSKCELVSLEHWDTGCGYCEAAALRMDTDDANATRSLRRSQVQLRRYVRRNSLTRLLTFTNGAEVGWQTRKAALDDVARFIKVHGVRCFGQNAVVMVAEQGGRGLRWHVHALIPSGRWLSYREIIRTWSTFLTNRGYISASGSHRWHAGDDKHQHSGGFSSARVAAGYAAKYLTKDMLLAGEYGSGLHRYRCSRLDFPRPVVSGFPSLADALADLECHAIAMEQVDALGTFFTIGYWFEGG